MTKQILLSAVIAIGAACVCPADQTAIDKQKSHVHFWGEQDAAKAYWDHHDKELKGQAENYEFLMRVASFYEKSRDISPDQDVEYAGSFVVKLQRMLKADAAN